MVFVMPLPSHQMGPAGAIVLWLFICLCVHMYVHLCQGGGILRLSTLVYT